MNIYMYIRFRGNIVWQKFIVIIINILLGCTMVLLSVSSALIRWAKNHILLLTRDTVGVGTRSHVPTHYSHSTGLCTFIV